MTRQAPLSANPNHTTVRYDGVYRGPTPTDASEYGQRTLADDTTTKNQRLKPQLERIQCPECLKMVVPRDDGTLRAHSARRGISCVGATPRLGNHGTAAQCAEHGDYRDGHGMSLLFTCGCPAPRSPRRSK